MRTENEQFISRLQDFLGKCKGSRFDKAASVYRMIMTSGDKEEAFKYFLEHADYIDSSEEIEIPRFFSETQIYEYEKNYGDLVDGILKKAVSKRNTPEEFYKELWEGIFATEIFFESEESKIFALGKIWSDGRIPYFQLKPGLKMSDENFKKVLEKNKEALQKITFILNCQFEQRTESGSALLDVINECENDDDKAVVLAKMMTAIEKGVLLRLMKSRDIS